MSKTIHLLFLFLLIACSKTLLAQRSDTLGVQLTDLFELADKNNRQLKIFSYNEQLAAENLQQQKDRLLPALEASLTLSYNGDGWVSDRNFSKGSTAPIPAFGNNFALQATQVIYAGGALKTAVELGKLDMMIAKLDKEKNKQDIRFMITGYYLELQKLQNQRLILESNMVQTDKLLLQLRNKYKQGVSLKNAVTRYELQKQSLELGLVQLESAEKIINNELLRTLQLPKGTRLAPKEEGKALSNETPGLVQWQALAKENAPLLGEAKLQIEQARQAEKLVQAGRKPELFAFAANRLDGPIMIEVPVINKNLNYWYAGAGVKYNIASLYASGSKIKASKIASRRAGESKLIREEQLDTDIEAAVIRTEEAEKVYATKLKAVQLASENYTIVRSRYLDDLVLITEMLDAENSKIDAEMQAANARINILYHYYQLKKLTGTL